MTIRVFEEVDPEAYIQAVKDHGNEKCLYCGSITKKSFIGCNKCSLSKELYKSAIKYLISKGVDLNDD